MNDSRTEYIAGLRALADVLERHQEVPVPYHGSSAGLSMMFLAEDARTKMAAAARALPCRLDKSIREAGYFNLDGSLRGLRLHLDVPLVEVTEEREVVEWRCGSLLNGGSSDGGGR